jgi:hypothetical protein
MLPPRRDIYRAAAGMAGVEPARRTTVEADTMVNGCRQAVALTLALLAGFAVPGYAGDWTPLVSSAPASPGTLVLLTDGTVMVQGFPDGSNWMQLTPDSSGSYINGTWSFLASMSIPRLYYALNILPSGQVWLLGGEYSGIGLPANWTNTGEMYDPLTDTWSPIASYPPQSGCPGGRPACFGDDPSMLLPGGQILAGNLLTGSTYVYDVASDTWAFAASKNYNDRSDEESWVKLPGNRVLTYDLFQSIAAAGGYAEQYDPATNTWSSLSPSDGTAFGTIPQLSSSAIGHELGPIVRLRDGRIFLLGATGHTALYDAPSNTWSAGPDITGTLGGDPALFGADDAPAAVLPNGHVLFAADAGPTLGTFHSPTQLFDYDPDANTIAPVSSAIPDGLLDTRSAYVTRMLVLPTGQLLFSDGSSQLWVYTPDGASLPAARPVINGVVYDGGGVFTLTGQQLTGQSSGSAYGDDVESDENYPIVRLTNADGVFYARTSNWSSVDVAAGSGTVDFTLQGGMMPGNYSLVVIGAGISSFPVFINFTPDEIAGS